MKGINKYEGYLYLDLSEQSDQAREQALRSNSSLWIFRAPPNKYDDEWPAFPVFRSGGEEFIGLAAVEQALAGLGSGLTRQGPTEEWDWDESSGEYLLNTTQ